jgi:hypothetical protein
MLRRKQTGRQIVSAVMKNNSKGEFGLTDVASANRRKTGRVIHEGGRGVWEWQTSTGVFTRDVSDDHLTRLEVSDLRIVEHAPIKIQDPMLKTLDRLATNSKSKAGTDTHAKGTLRSFLKKWL